MPAAADSEAAIDECLADESDAANEAADDEDEAEDEPPVAADATVAPNGDMVRRKVPSPPAHTLKVPSRLRVPNTKKRDANTVRVNAKKGKRRVRTEQVISRKSGVEVAILRTAVKPDGHVFVQIGQRHNAIDHVAMKA